MRSECMSIATNFTFKGSPGTGEMARDLNQMLQGKETLLNLVGKMAYCWGHLERFK